MAAVNIGSNVISVEPLTVLHLLYCFIEVRNGLPAVFLLFYTLRYSNIPTCKEAHAFIQTRFRPRNTFQIYRRIYHQLATNECGIA